MTITLPSPFTLIALDRVASTNDEARARAGQGAGHGLAIMAAEQTAGRGRRGRSWFSPRGNLHCSILLDGGPDAARIAELAFVAAIALRDALAALAPTGTFTCKWPNDVLVDGAKVAGMLLENAAPWVILGVGVNLIAAPEEPMYPAASVASLGVTITPEQALVAFVGQLDRWYAIWRSRGFGSIRQAWLDRAGGVGGDIVVRLADASTLSGHFADLDEQGALLLDVPGGGRRRVLAGDVFFAA
jgi:BirA family biotin operon repressor/biotin-[acetyl-CoA-carboxylase] ligase